MKVNQKVLTVITHGRRVLVFDHVDDPEVGIQVQDGTPVSHESPEEAVMRKAQEETGLGDWDRQTFVGEVDFDVPHLQSFIAEGFISSFVRETLHMRGTMIRLNLPRDHRIPFG